jgi:hypothetical protein
MVEAFTALGKDGIGSPDALSAAIGHTLESTLIGFIGNNVGILVCLFALWHYQLRRKWMFWASIVLSLLVMPCGLSLLVYCLVQRHEFFGRRWRFAEEYW